MAQLVVPARGITTGARAVDFSPVRLWIGVTNTTFSGG